MIADSITVSRIVFSLVLFFLQPSSAAFWGLYLLCGETDVLDGLLARALHTESNRGALLDSIADIVFALLYAVKILPCFALPPWIWVWIIGIGAVKAAGIFLQSKKEQNFFIQHSFANKLLGVLLFLLPLTIPVRNGKYGAVTVCAIATVTAITEWNEGCERKRTCVNIPPCGNGFVQTVRRIFRCRLPK